MSDNTSVPFWEIQKATHTRLEGVITGKVYDEVPKEAVFPYTTFTRFVDSSLEARGVKGRMVFMTLTVSTRDDGGGKACMDILQQIVVEMTKSKLSMTGWAEMWKDYRMGSLQRMSAEPGTFPYEGTITFLITVVKK
jgi:hypothetical protein